MTSDDDHRRRASTARAAACLLPDGRRQNADVGCSGGYGPLSMRCVMILDGGFFLEREPSGRVCGRAWGIFRKFDRRRPGGETWRFPGTMRITICSRRRRLRRLTQSPERGFFQMAKRKPVSRMVSASMLVLLDDNGAETARQELNSNDGWAFAAMQKVDGTLFVLTRDMFGGCARITRV